jgi:hypothetical protein
VSQEERKEGVSSCTNLDVLHRKKERREVFCPHLKLLHRKRKGSEVWG